MGVNISKYVDKCIICHIKLTDNINYVRFHGYTKYKGFCMCLLCLSYKIKYNLSDREMRDKIYNIKDKYDKSY